MSTRIRIIGLVVLGFASLQAPSVALSQTDPPAQESGDEKAEIASEATVGMAAKLEAVVMPGAPLMAKPMEDRHQAFVLRIIDTYKHGTDHRYDMEYYALEPGRYNVSDYLVRDDGSEPEGLPDVWVTVGSTLAAGQITPGEPPLAPLPRLGGYWLLWTLGGILWVVGLACLLFAGRHRRSVNSGSIARPVTMAERLRPLVRAAMAGQLDSGGRAELERTLIAYWCKRLDVKASSPAEAIGILRQDRQAGPLLSSLEDWLHRPDPPQDIDLEKLLEPYREITDEDIEVKSTAMPRSQAMIGQSGAMADVAGEQR